MGLGCADDDFGAGGRDADFAACVALFGEFAGEEFVEFGKEDAVGDKLIPRVRIRTRREKEREKRVGVQSLMSIAAFIDDV